MICRIGRLLSDSSARSPWFQPWFHFMANGLRNHPQYPQQQEPTETRLAQVLLSRKPLHDILQRTKFANLKVQNRSSQKSFHRARGNPNPRLAHRPVPRQARHSLGCRIDSMRRSYSRNRPELPTGHLLAPKKVSWSSTKSTIMKKHILGFYMLVKFVGAYPSRDPA